MKNLKLYSFLIFLSAFFHVFLIYAFPPNSGGGSIAFIFTVPFIFLLSITLGLTFHFKIGKNPNKLIRKFYFYLSISAILLIGYYAFPCTTRNETNSFATPCPCAFIQHAIEIKANEDKIDIQDVFKEDGNIYLSMLKQTAALKKFKDSLPELPVEAYDVYNSITKESYVIYFKNGRAYSTNQQLVISEDTNNKLCYMHITKGDTLTFASSKDGFHKDDDIYAFTNYTNDFKKKYKTGKIEFSPRKINRYREYFIYDFIYNLIDKL